VAAAATSARCCSFRRWRLQPPSLIVAPVI
jgi:hypothetical protein